MTCYSSLMINFKIFCLTIFTLILSCASKPKLSERPVLWIDENGFVHHDEPSIEEVADMTEVSNLKGMNKCLKLPTFYHKGKNSRSITYSKTEAAKMGATHINRSHLDETTIIRSWDCTHPSRLKTNDKTRRLKMAAVRELLKRWVKRNSKSQTDALLLFPLKQKNGEKHPFVDVPVYKFQEWR